MKVKNTEQRTLTVGIIINLLMSITGLAIFSVTHLQALFLDASFVLIEVISGIIAITISKVSQNKIRGFPKGLFNLEPIYIFLKSILVITLMGLTTWNVSLRNCLRSKLSFGILLQKRKLLCLIIPVILLANSLKSFAQN